jgi:hypothetical protein
MKFKALKLNASFILLLCLQTSHLRGEDELWIISTRCCNSSLACCMSGPGYPFQFKNHSRIVQTTMLTLICVSLSRTVPVPECASQSPHFRHRSTTTGRPDHNDWPAHALYLCFLLSILKMHSHRNWGYWAYTGPCFTCILNPAKQITAIWRARHFLKDVCSLQRPDLKRPTFTTFI